MALNGTSPPGKASRPPRQLRWDHHPSEGGCSRGETPRPAPRGGRRQRVPAATARGHLPGRATLPGKPRRAASAKRLTLQTYFFPPRTKALKGKKKTQAKERKREKGLSTSPEGSREHPRLCVERAIKQEADERQPATKELMQPRHFKHQRLSGLASQTRAIKLRPGLIFKDTIGKGHGKLLGS